MEMTEERKQAILDKSPEFKYALDEDLLFVDLDSSEIPCENAARLAISVIRYTTDDILMKTDLIDLERKGMLMSELIVSHLAVVGIFSKGQALMNDSDARLIKEVVEHCAFVLVEAEPQEA